MATSGAKRYARAIFELAQEDGQVPAWARRLAMVRDALTRPEARTVLSNPSIAARRREDLAGALVEDRAGPQGRNLARLLVAAGRLDDLDGIVEEYGRLADEAAGRVRATVTTAVPLGDGDAQRLTSHLAVRLGQEVRLDRLVDPQIVGGLVLRVGDRVMDASVATRLRQLRRQLANV